MVEKTEQQTLPPLTYYLSEITLKRLIISPDFLLSMLFSIITILTVVLATEDYSKKSEILIGVVKIIIPLATTLLGLVLAAYAIFSAMQNNIFSSILAKSGLFNEILGVFSLSALILAGAITTGLVDFVILDVVISIGFNELLSFAGFGIFCFTFFLTLYGILLITILATSTMRQILELRKSLQN